MPTKRALVIFAGVIFIVAAGFRASARADSDAAALAFVTKIYAQYGRHDTNAHPLDKDGGIRRYFEPSLAAAIIKDRNDAARRGDEGNLDFDPFIDANDDWDLSKPDIAIADGGPGKATATVKFVVDKRPTTVVIELLRVDKNWRVNEIIWMRDGKPATLRQQIAH